MDITLRKFSPEDAPRVAELVGDREVSRWTSNIPYPYTQLDAVEWINKMALDTSARAFAVELDDQLVACISHWPNASGEIEIGYWVGRPYWGKGICSTALRLMLDGKSFPAGSDIYARVMESNAASRRVLEKAGFTYLENTVIRKAGKASPAQIYVRRAAL
ncbi:N-acetyltransferase [Mangrovimicrobium sediminis]|uniref:N-acetyltransferase n=1 Tax=Mangrovimicrobium sediminis TaxID=2562682 RepID=A0A4Z0MA16_9GAMM|nr:GNAT family N-acetyltransferase [Haliea sp. SAOS-164]TGD76246.1 N-acetyltransferase [Haliea sp. SAOS-164]